MIFNKSLKEIKNKNYITMALVRYNRLNDFIPSTFGDVLENVLRESGQGNKDFYPAVDIVKNEKAIELQMIVPGMQKSDFSINVEDERLVISGERKRPEDINFTQIESGYGSFERSFKLSKRVDQEKISATYDAGILKVTLPLIDEAKLKTVIKVK